ncbi:MAG: ABC transporter permease [Bacillota bacterium]|nr:ABC transporter permease [Bacillota bacterium]
MFLRMILGALIRQRNKMFMIAFTIALGTSLSTAMLNTMFGVGDKVNMELKAYGANINVLPRDASLLDDIYGFSADETKARKYIKEEELGLVKTIFWAFNIVDYTPYFTADVDLVGEDVSVKAVGTWFDYHMDLPTGESVNTGMKRLKSWWNVEGEWLEDHDANACMVGSLFALRNALNTGDQIELRGKGDTKTLKIKGIFNSGSEDDERIYTTLKTAQELSGLSGVVNRIEVSALTTPDNELARKAAINPLSLTVKEWEVWYCTAYVSAICYQLQEVITDSVAKPIRQVAESEGDILNKTTLLMLLITALSMAGAALGISNIVTAGVMERRAEIGLKKALGAGNTSIILTMLTEIFITGILGGVIGYFGGLFITQIIGYRVFGSTIPITPVVVPIVAVMIFLVSLLGSIPAIKYLLRLNPTEVLHGR